MEGLGKLSFFFSWGLFTFLLINLHLFHFLFILNFILFYFWFMKHPDILDIQKFEIFEKLCICKKVFF